MISEEDYERFKECMEKNIKDARKNPGQACKYVIHCLNHNIEIVSHFIKSEDDEYEDDLSHVLTVYDVNGKSVVTIYFEGFYYSRERGVIWFSSDVPIDEGYEGYESIEHACLNNL